METGGKDRVEKENIPWSSVLKEENFETTPIAVGDWNSDLVVEKISLSSLMKLICEQQAVITSQQELVSSKEQQIVSLQAVITSLQQTNQLQEEANQCLWREIKGKEVVGEQDAGLSVSTGLESKACA